MRITSLHFAPPLTIHIETKCSSKFLSWDYLHLSLILWQFLGTSRRTTPNCLLNYKQISPLQFPTQSPHNHIHWLAPHIYYIDPAISSRYIYSSSSILGLAHAAQVGIFLHILSTTRRINLMYSISYMLSTAIADNTSCMLSLRSGSREVPLSLKDRIIYLILKLVSTVAKGLDAGHWHIKSYLSQGACSFKAFAIFRGNSRSLLQTRSIIFWSEQPGRSRIILIIQSKISKHLSCNRVCAYLPFKVTIRLGANITYHYIQCLLDCDRPLNYPWRVAETQCTSLSSAILVALLLPLFKILEQHSTNT